MACSRAPRRRCSARPATEEAFAAAAAAELAAAQPLRDNGYKVPLLTNMIVQVLAGLAARMSR